MLIFTEQEIKWIRSEVTASDKTKYITDNLLAFIYEKKLFKLIVPEEVNGFMLSFPEAIRTFQEASRIDGTFGWLVTIGSGGGMFVPNFTEEVAKIYYSPKQAVIAGSGFPAGTAKKVDGGYIVNGEWFYCSGSQYASIFTATCKVESSGSEKHSQLLSFIFEPEQVKVIEDWNAIGLKGTSSHTISITDQFVPDYRTFSIIKKQNNNYLDNIYDFPFLMFSEASFTAIVFGIGEHFLETVQHFLKEKKSLWGDDRYTLIDKIYKREKAHWCKARNLFYDQVYDSWKKHLQNKRLTAKEQEYFGFTCRKAVSTVLTCVDTLFRLIGMQAVKEESLINRIWRDLHTAAQHAFLTPQTKEDISPLT